MLKIKALLLVVVVVAVAWFVHSHHQNKDTLKQAVQKTANTAKTAATNTATQALASHCAGISGQEVIVSISAQHLWACDGTSVSYDNAVITGMEQYPADLTPVGTYKITGKLTDQTLAGSDSTGHWSDFVNYWMPFLANQYGTYGFHDLTQTANGANGRADSDFGNIDINAPYTAAKHASHGCVEMPLTAMKWLYGWAAVGTTVSIVS
jgi:lipoprotein-anchoring transpeptidase ErfK/SrfK